MIEFLPELCSVQPVQESQISVVSIKLLVMQVVEIRLVVPSRPGPLEAAMMGLRSQHREHTPDEEGVDMRIDTERPESQREKIGHDQLDGVAVDGRKRVGGCKLVVDLVHVWNIIFRRQVNARPGDHLLIYLLC